MSEFILWPWLHHGDSAEILPTLPDDLADALVCDPPAGFDLLERGWDSDKGGRDKWVHWLAGILSEARRVCKPGAPAMVWAIPRTSHWTARAMENAGWIVDDIVAQVCSTGMPKGPGMISGSIDRMRHNMEELLVVTNWLRNARDRARLTNAKIDALFGANGMAGHWCAPTRGAQPLIPTLEQVPQLLDLLGVSPDDVPDDVVALLLESNGYKGDPGENWDKREVVGFHEAAGGCVQWHNRYMENKRKIEKKAITLSASEQAKRWEGWGSVLKPSAEHWILAHAPGGDGVQLRQRRALYTRKAIGADACREYNEHPTVKHTDLMAQIVDIVTESGQVVIDPFMGSGTTGVACGRMGRRFVGIEMEDRSFRTCVQRIVDQSEQPARTTPAPAKSVRRKRNPSRVIGKRSGGVL
jgi:DNA modification methylase